MKNRALIALITIVAAIFGGLALTNLKQELAPSITFPQLAVLTALCQPSWCTARRTCGVRIVRILCKIFFGLCSHRTAQSNRREAAPALAASSECVQQLWIVAFSPSFARSVAVSPHLMASRNSVGVGGGNEAGGVIVEAGIEGRATSVRFSIP